MHIDDIIIGGRHRKDLGDIDGLARSIANIGLIQPIAIRPDKTLVAGERRIAAYRLLGLSDIPVIVLSNLDEEVAYLQAERDENTCRKDFTPTEAVALARDLEPAERKAAEERHGARTDLHAVNFTGSRGAAMDRVASAVGVSRPTLTKAKAVVDAAEREPALFGDLPDTMDRTGKVDRAYTELRRRQSLAQNEALVANTAPAQVAISTDHYQTIVIDPPWDWGDEGDVDQYGRARPVYATMPIEQIAALPVGQFAQANAHIYLWITNRSLPKGFDILTGWGFRYVTMLTWVKPSFGMGNYFRGSTEHVLFGVRGSLSLLRHDVPTHFTAPRPGIHSDKPDTFYELVQTCSPGPWLEMFARTERPGWTPWGADVCH